MTVPNPPLSPIANRGTARYAGPCSHDPGGCRILAGDDVVFWRPHDSDKWAICCAAHARDADLLDASDADEPDPLAVADNETLCPDCFCYHRGECQ